VNICHIHIQNIVLYMVSSLFSLSVLNLIHLLDIVNLGIVFGIYIKALASVFWPRPCLEAKILAVTLFGTASNIWPHLTSLVFVDCSYRFTDMFPDMEHVRDMQRELDQIIHAGVINITRLMRNSETSVSSGVAEDGEDEFEMKRRTKPRLFSAKSLLDLDDEDSKYATEQRKAVNFQTKSEHAADESEFALQSGERLTDHLVKKGLLTKSMLRQLQQELSEKVCKHDTDTKS